MPQIIGICTSEDSNIWLPVFLGYKGIILLAGLFLAFETRKVKIKSLNESRFIAMSVYGAVVVAITLTLIVFWLRNFPTVQYALFGIMIMSTITLILGLIFVARVSIKFYQAFSYSYYLCIYIVVQGIQRSTGHKELGSH